MIRISNQQAKDIERFIRRWQLKQLISKLTEIGGFSKEVGNLKKFRNRIRFYQENNLDITDTSCIKINDLVKLDIFHILDTILTSYHKRLPWTPVDFAVFSNAVDKYYSENQEECDAAIEFAKQIIKI